MLRIRAFCLVLIMVLGLSGCSLPNMSEPTPSLPVFPPATTKVTVNTLPPPLPTFTKSSSAQTLVATLSAPTLPALTATLAATKPAATATQPQPTATKPAATATQPPATKAPPTATVTAKEARIYMIALNDNGGSGKKIGCGDSAVAVTVLVSDPKAPLRGALDKLFAVRTQYYGQSGLYNALFRSDLHIVSVAVENGIAEIKLSGSLTLGGVCDAPRVQAQLEEIALQFSTVKQVNVTINGKKLQDLLSGK